MIDLLEAYRVSTKTVADLARNTLRVTLVECAPEEAYVRLEKQPFVLSEDVEKFTKIVTAHKLSQYQNKIHTIKLEEEVDTWLDILIKEDVEEKERTIL